MTVINTNADVFDSLGLSRKQAYKPEETKQDQFMKLMLAQLKNQDPLEPQENGKFLTQLAQFDTATGIKDLQKSFTSFTNTMQSNSALQASSLVGRDVLVPGDKSYLTDDSGVGGKIDLGASTNKLKVEVIGPGGQTVRVLDLGRQAAGEINFHWDGKDENGNILPPGTYQFNASAQVGNENIAQPVFMLARVDSVSIGAGGQGLKLNLPGIGQVDLSSVKEIK